MSWRPKARPEQQSSCWLIYLGSGVPGPDEGDDLTLAAVTATEGEALTLLHQALAVRMGRSNMVEDRPFYPGAERSVLATGEKRVVYVLVTGDRDHEEGREVCVSREDAAARQDGLRARGLLDARVREIVTNTWLVDL